MSTLPFLLLGVHNRRRDTINCKLWSHGRKKEETKAKKGEGGLFLSPLSLFYGDGDDGGGGGGKRLCEQQHGKFFQFLSPIFGFARFAFPVKRSGTLADCSGPNAFLSMNEKAFSTLFCVIKGILSAKSCDHRESF